MVFVKDPIMAVWQYWDVNLQFYELYLKALTTKPPQQAQLPCTD